MDTQPIVALTYKGQVLAMPYSLFCVKFGIEEAKREECRLVMQKQGTSIYHLGNEEIPIRYIEDIGTQLIYRLGVLGVKFIEE